MLALSGAQIGALSATGTRPFGEGADGFVFGEGSAVFLLNVAYYFWRQITGRAASDPPPQKVIHIHRRLF